MRIIIDLIAGLMVALSLLVPKAHAQQPVIPYVEGTSKSTASPVKWTPVLLAGQTSTVTSVVSGQPAKLGYVYCYNGTGAVAYLQIFDAATAGAVMVGTTAPKLSLGIPTAQASGLGPALIGVTFALGIQVASTTTATGSSTATMDCNAGYN